MLECSFIPLRSLRSLLFIPRLPPFNFCFLLSHFLLSLLRSLRFLLLVHGSGIEQEETEITESRTACWSAASSPSVPSVLSCSSPPSPLQFLLSAFPLSAFPSLGCASNGIIMQCFAGGSVTGRMNYVRGLAGVAAVVS